MFAEFIGDDELLQHAIIIEMVARPLEDRYDSDLKSQAGPLEDMIKWNIDRSTGLSWWGTALAIMKQVNSQHLAEKLKLTVKCRPPIPMDLTVQWIVEPRQILQFSSWNLPVFVQNYGYFELVLLKTKKVAKEQKQPQKGQNCQGQKSFFYTTCPRHMFEPAWSF